MEHKTLKCDEEIAQQIIANVNALINQGWKPEKVRDYLAYEIVSAKE